MVRNVDLPEIAVRTWRKQAGIDQGERPKLTADKRSECDQLRRETGRLGEDVDILKHAAAFFLELTHLLAHPIVSQGSQEGVPDGSPLEIPGGVPA